ncbi:MAG: acyltransferase [Kofleriaceae bacterium]|nr:acyltransferase [Kofleriaceae bacterium]
MPTVAAPTTPARGRLEFLEGVRGIAALLVLVLHLIETLSPRVTFIHRVFDPGTAGVIAFFLVSGFVIPLSLERSHSLRQFWIGRVFRIFPLYLVVLAAGVAAAVATLAPYAVEGAARWPARLGSHLVLLQEPAGFPDLVPGSWTLLVEFVFYGAIALAYGLGWLRRTTPLVLVGAAGLAGLALAAIALDRRLPLGRPCLLTFGLLGLAFLRHWQGQLTTRRLVLLGVVVVAAGSLAYWQNFGLHHHKMFAFACVELSFLLALALFVAAYAVRATSWMTGSRVATFIGSLTYSVYLVHPLVLAIYAHYSRSPLGYVIVPAASLVVASATYRWVERPGMALGRRLAGRQPDARA